MSMTTDSQNAVRSGWLISSRPSARRFERFARPSSSAWMDSVIYALRVVVPLTDWKPRYAGRFWLVRHPGELSEWPAQGLGSRCLPGQVGVRDALHVDCLGVASAHELDAIANAVASSSASRNWPTSDAAAGRPVSLMHQSHHIR